MTKRKHRKPRFIHRVKDMETHHNKKKTLPSVRINDDGVVELDNSVQRVYSTKEWNALPVKKRLLLLAVKLGLVDAD